MNKTSEYISGFLADSTRAAFSKAGSGFNPLRGDAALTVLRNVQRSLAELARQIEGLLQSLDDDDAKKKPGK
jgi:hypothetical protein